jgi:Flp pilus assembly protein TadG
MSNFRMPYRSFTANQRGSVTVIFSLSILFLVMLAGLAIDTARFHDVSSRMQAALDASVLAGAKLLADENSTISDIEQMTQTHFSEGVKTIAIKTSSVAPLAINIDRVASSVSASVSATVPSLFGNILGRGPMTLVNQSSKVVYDRQPIELSMVLDITGSMNNNNKISDMKAAAKDVIDSLFKDALSDNSVRIAVAPYSASVNAGGLAGAVTNIPPTTTCSSNWWNGPRCQTVAGVDADTCVIERTGLNAATDAAPLGADQLPNVPTTPYGNYTCPAATVIPLLGKSQVATIKTTIDSYVASGATAGHIGTAWGWYLLSPEWAGVLPSASEPKPYGDKSVLKSMIIMTDGLFNTSYISGGSTPSAQMSTESYAQFDALCTSIKAKDITIYTVGFDLSDPTALAKLQGCASGTTNFFDAKTGADLKKAFNEIADRLTTMRVAS